MAEAIGCAAAALQLAAQGIALVHYAIKMRSCTLTLEQYQERIETLRKLCLDVQSNPAFENTKDITAQTQSILDTIELKDLSSILNKSRLRRTFGFVRNEKALLEHLATLQDKKSTLSLQVQNVNSRALHDMCFGSMGSKDKTLHRDSRPHRTYRTEPEIAESFPSSSRVPAYIWPTSQQQWEDRRGPSQNSQQLDPSAYPQGLTKISEPYNYPSALQVYQESEHSARSRTNWTESTATTQELDRSSAGHHQGIQAFRNHVEGHADQNFGVKLGGNVGSHHIRYASNMDFKGALFKENWLVGTGEQNFGVSIDTKESAFDSLPVPVNMTCSDNVLRVVGNSKSSQNFGTVFYK